MSDDFDALARDYMAQPPRQTLAPQVKYGVTSGMQVAPDPDTEAKMRRAADLVGVPYDAARGNFGEVEQQARFQSLDLDTVADKTPVAARYLSNPDNAAIAHDDVHNLGFIESAMNQLKGLGQSTSQLGGGYGRFLWTMGGGNRAANANPNDPTWKFAAFIHGMSTEQYIKQVRDEDTAFEKHFKAGEKADYGYKPVTSWQDVKQNPLGKGLPFVAEQGVQSVPSMVGVAVNAPAFVAAQSGQMAQHRAENDKRQNATAGDLAIVTPAAAAQAYLEKLGLDKMFGVGAAAKAGLKGVVLETGKAAVVEAGTEAAQQGAQDVAETAGTKKGFNLGETVDDMLASAFAGFGIGGAVHGTVETVHHAAGHAARTDMQRQAQAQTTLANARAVDQFAKASQQSKLRERSPDDFKEYVRQVAEAGSIDSVYVPAETFAQAMNTDEGRAALQEMPAVAQQFETAVATGQDVKIPVEDFATHIAPLPNYAKIADHLKTEPEGMTRAEAQSAVADQVENLKADFEKVMREKSGDEAFAQSRKAVQDNIKAQLDTTKRFTPDVNARYAELAAHSLATLAARLNITPEEAFARYPLRVTAGDGSVIGAQLAQPMYTGYHAAEVPIEQFKPLSYGDSGDHSYFYFAKSKKWSEAFHRETRGEAPMHMHKAQLDIRNPLDLRDKVMSGPQWQQFFTDVGAAPEGEFADKLANAKQDIPAWSVLRFDTPKLGGMREKLMAAGYDGLVLTDTKRGTADRTAYVAFSPDQIRLQGDLKQAGDDGARGTFNPNNLTIALNKNADFSTFLHELGHFHLEVLADLASRPDAHPEIAADMQTLLKWFDPGLTLEKWRAMSLDEQRPYHEQFARGFETYLFEGKAPTLPLKRLFQRFSAWLVNIYRQASNLHAELSDDVRGVMDRMVATRDAIAETEQARGLVNPFAEKPEGMTETEWQELNDLSHDATLDAQSTLQARSLRDMKWLEGARSRELRRLQREAAAKRKEVRDQVTAEVMAEPINQARRYLTHGEIDGQTVEGAAKLDLFTVKEMFPQIPEAEITKALGTGKYGMVAENGEHPDIAADRFGFTSGEGLIHHLLSDEPARAKIQGVTDQRMLEQYGDLIDPESMSRAADEAVHNTARVRFMATALAALDKSLGDRNVLMAATKTLAADVVGRQTIRDLRPDLYLAAEARAGRAVLKAMKSGDLETASAEMRKQLFNAQAAKAAFAARDTLAKGDAFFKKIISGKDDNVSKSRNMDLVNAARAILEAYGYERAKNNPSAYMEQLQKYDEVLYRDIAPTVEASIANAPASRDARDMTVDQFNALRDTVAQLYDLSRRSQQIRVEGQLHEIADVARRLATALGDGPGPHAGVGKAHAVTTGQELGSWLLGNIALLRRVEDWAIAKGPEFHALLFQVLSDASLEYRQLSAKYRHQLLTNLKAIREDLTNRKIEAPELAYTFGAGNGGGGLAELIGALRHTGNESNLEKMLVGRGWGEYARDGSLDTSKWDAFIQRMHDQGILQKRHWDYVQSEWDLHEEIKPLVQKAHRDVFGRFFEEIEIRPVSTPFGEYKGGYVPATTDPRIVDEATMRQDAEALLGGSGGSFMFPTPASGFTKARNANYAKALALDLTLAGQQIDAALKFATLASPVRDVLRVVRHPEFADKLKTYDPAAATDLLLPWLQRTANQSTSTPFTGKSGRGNKAVLETIRQRAIMAIMFGNVANTLANVTGIAPAMLRTGTTPMLGAAVKYLTNPKGTAARVAEVSPFMADRMSNQMREMHDQVQAIVKDQNILEKAQDWSLRHTYFLQSCVQNVVDQIIWTAAFDRGTAMGEANPVHYADMVVRTTQGSSNAVDVSRFETGSPIVKMFTTFSGYFTTQANLLGTEFARAAARKSPLGVLNVYMLGFLAPSFGAYLVGAAVHGGIEDRNKDGSILDDLLKAFFGSQVSYGAGMVPIVGPLTGALVNRATGQSRDVAINTSPVVSVAEGALGTPFDIAQLAQGKGSTSKTIRDAASLVTILTGIPATLLARPLAYGADVASGKVEPTGPVDATRGAVTGQASPASKQ